KAFHSVRKLIISPPTERRGEPFHLVSPRLQGPPAEVDFDDRLYLTSPDALYDRLKAVPIDAKSVLMIGHNPGLHGLALMLLGTGDAKSISRLEDKLPTAALAVFTFPQVAWRDLIPAAGRLEAFITPRDRA